MLNIEDDRGRYAESLKRYHRQTVVPRKAIDNTVIASKDEDMIPDPENEVQDGPLTKGLSKGLGNAVSGLGSAAKGIGETVEGAGHAVARLASAGEDTSVMVAAKTGSRAGENIAEGKVY